MTNGQQIDALRKAGYRVNVAHRRPHLDTPGDLITRRQAELRGLPTDRFPARGGMTTITIQNESELWEADAYCNPNDSFNRRLGTTIALGRALKMMKPEPEW